MKKSLLALSLIALLSTTLLTSCGSYKEDGAVKGGVAGSFIGLATGDSLKSTLIGGAVGAAIGGIAGSIKDASVRKKLAEFDSRLEALIATAPSEEIHQQKLDLIVLEFDYLNSKYDAEKAASFLKKHLETKGFSITLSLDDLKYLREKSVSYQLIDALWTFEPKTEPSSV